ncbi:MAG: acyl-CoA dehydrogenase family protein [Hyphomonadaceae bacterium]|nr:acyl-CoA dehydrogenase family protein [Hyphomonadaceae bacterium]
MKDIVSAARDFAPTLAGRSDEIETARRLPPDIAQAMAKAGLFRAIVPKSLGGHEARADAVAEMIEAVARADASTAWCLMIGSTTALNAAYLPLEEARTIYGAPDAIACGVYAPLGRAIPDGDDYVVTGRWAWGSGTQNARWIAGGAFVMDGEKPALGPDGAPYQRMIMFRAEDVTFHDTWHVMGLKGTGSLDFSVEGVRVPKARSVSLIHDAPRETGPLYRFPAFGLLGMGIAAVALGNAAGALESFRDLATSKKPAASRRTLAERAHTQMTFAEAHAAHAAARALYFAAIADAWREAEAGDAISLEGRVKLRLASTHATRTCAKICSELHDLAGGSAVYLNNPLQRRFRDAHVMTQHMMVAPPTLEVAGRALLGLPTDDMML